jgi:hypothetical protein
VRGGQQTAKGLVREVLLRASGHKVFPSEGTVECRRYRIENQANDEPSPDIGFGLLRFDFCAHRRPYRARACGTRSTMSVEGWPRQATNSAARPQLSRSSPDCSCEPGSLFAGLVLGRPASHCAVNGNVNDLRHPLRGGDSSTAW